MNNNFENEKDIMLPKVNNHVKYPYFCDSAVQQCTTQGGKKEKKDLTKILGGLWLGELVGYQQHAKEIHAI